MAVSEQEVNRLYEQLHEAYQEIADLQRRASESSSKMQNELRRVTIDMQRSTGQLQEELIQRWKTLENSMCEAYAQEVTEMRQSYKSLQDTVSDLENQYNEALTQLVQEQQNIIAEKEQRDSRIRDIAIDEESKFQQALNLAYQQPVEAFHPHSIEDYRKAGERARKLLQSGLYSLAATDFSNCRMGIMSITEDTQKKVKDIEMMFELYKSLLAQIDILSTSPWELKDENGGTYLSLDKIEDIDYWSDMLYTQLSELIDEHKKIVSDGVLEWIHANANKGISPELMLDHKIRSLEYIPSQLQICISYALSACDCYNQLFDIRDIVNDVMLEQNYYYESTTFGACRPSNDNSKGFQYYLQWLKDEKCIDRGKAPDFREERCIQYKNTEGNICMIHIIPVRYNAIVSFNLYLESISALLPSMVENSLRIALENALSFINCHVRIYDKSNSELNRQNENRILTYEGLKVLSAMPDERKMKAKYCTGV